MSKITINQLNSGTQELTVDEYKNINGGFVDLLIKTGLQLISGQAERIKPYEKIAAQEFLSPDSVTGL